VRAAGRREWDVELSFEGAGDGYVRREIGLPLVSP
jgi:hypothetical protein